MNCIPRRLLLAFLLFVAVFSLVLPAHGQDNMSVSARQAITVLDSTKEQDGLVGSVRRVKTETAKIELKDGRAVEGPTQLIEVTTYGIKGNRIENTSYPIGGGLVGKEEYKYDERGNIIEMTVRDDRGAIVNRETYAYEFDKFGNWTKMTTSLVVFENGQLKREPVEVTYRTVTYYFDDNVAKIVDEPTAPVERPRANTAPAVPEPASFTVRDAKILQARMTSAPGESSELHAEPPPLLKQSKPEGTESAFSARKQTELLTENVAAKPDATPIRTEPRIDVQPKAVMTASPENVAAANIKHAYDFYLAGRDRFESGDVQGAIDRYLESLKVESRSAEVQLSLGHAYLKLQKDREAVKAFKESVKLNPNVAEAQYGLGFISFRIGRFREAADAFKKATTLDNRMAKAHYGLALAYQELGMNQALMDEYRTLETLDKNLAKKLVQTFPHFNFSCRAMNGCP